MYIDKDDFTAWMERIMDRFDMQDKNTPFPYVGW